MTKPKFEIGQLVRIAFNGEVEGTPVEVTRKLYVSRVSWGTWQGHYNTPMMLYRLCETMEAVSTTRAGIIGNTLIGPGKEWDNIPESRLSPIEPLVEEMIKAEAGANTSQ